MTSSIDRPGTANGEVEVRGLAKRYGAVDALQPTSFRVTGGTFVTLLGPSGSGKTTLLKLIAGFEEPSAGSVHISGHAITDMAPYRRNVGFVFQQYALFPHLTVAQNVSYPLEMRRMPRVAIDKAVANTLELVRLSDLARRRPSQLSGGQQQRVALARAIVFRPPVLLMDEPMAALDKRLREEMQLEIRGLQRTLGITTISVTHDQSEALVMSDRILVLRDGMLQQSGTPEDLYHNPRNEFVASFVGESNILRGRVENGPGGPSMALGDGLGIPLGAPAPPAGAEIVCVLRPEAIEIGGEPSVDHFETVGEVVDRIFCGDVVRVRLRLVGAPETTLVAKMPTQRRLVFVPDTGTMVRVAWRTEELIVIERH
ncbi:MAG: ABC transporter ATP-binding protein [Alphaproteobacteria bacterium]|nr:ABC transporter ATP-binding protein [Alphaproteobacteria bacterium]